MEKILRLPLVTERTGKSRSGIYAAIAQGAFPAPIDLGKRSVGWLESDITAWISDRINDRNQRRSGCTPHKGGQGL